MNDMTFHCRLVLQNDPDCSTACECLTVHVMNKIYHDYQGRAYTDQRNARIYILSEFLKNYVEEITDASSNQMTRELILGALQAIDFREIAEDLIGDYSPKTAEAVAESEEFFAVMGFSDYVDED